MKKEIIILKPKKGFFGQTRKPWVSLDVELFRRTFEDAGFLVEVKTFDSLANEEELVRDKTVIFAFSQKQHLRNYIRDVIYVLGKHNTIIPKYSLLKCHENKGFQELLKKQLGFQSLKSYYLNDISQIDHYPLKYPVILKAIEGSNGKFVYRIEDKQQLKRTIRAEFTEYPLRKRFDIWRRRYFSRKKIYPKYPDHSNYRDVVEYEDYIRHCKPFILQEYVADLEYDYRILILFDKYFVTKRHVRKNDFRASGAKKFDFDFEPDPDLINYAKSFFCLLDQPILSLDICEKNGNFYLLEFQASHFGINVFMKSSGYYLQIGEKWEFIDKKDSFEKELATAYIQYLAK
jgi:glutathione synthase/RimK-type ligase-like ATP-grasp enzyme